MMAERATLDEAPGPAGPAEQPTWSAVERWRAPAAELRAPALAVIDATPHLVWGAERSLFHAWRTALGWTSPQRIAAGHQPALAATPDGRLHCLFAHWVGANPEIYHSFWDGDRWSLPAVVSRTSGISRHPALTVAATGQLYAAWADTTPGRLAIYSAGLVGQTWRNEPVPNAYGSRPTVAATADGCRVLAWQQRLPDKRIAVIASRAADAGWRLPEQVSLPSEGHSLRPQLAATPGGACHLLWQGPHAADEPRFGVWHAHLRQDGWSQPDAASAEAGEQPGIAASARELIQATWVSGATLQHRVRPAIDDAAWGEVEAVALPYSPAGMALALDAEGAAHIAWIGADVAGKVEIGYLRRAPLREHTTFVPVV